jgi:hypothetical protein
MPYEPTTPAARELKVVYDYLNGAQHDWNTYATELGRAYTTAYKFHEGALGEVKEKYRLESETQYWVFSLLCVAATGGLVGGLLAPWVAGAGAAIAKQMIRTFANETAQATAGGVVGRYMPSGASGSEFKPAVKDPTSYKDDMIGELGICYFELRRELERMMQVLDKPQPDDETIKASKRFKEISKSPLANAPKTLPDKAKVARSAEIGMWLAWASRRKTDYWNKRYRDVRAMRDGPVSRTPNPYLLELEHYGPVVRRMYALSIKDHSTTEIDVPYFTRSSSYQQKGYYKVRVIDFNKLQLAGFISSIFQGDDVYMSNIIDVIKQPQKVLSSLVGLPPLHMRTA